MRPSRLAATLLLLAVACGSPPESPPDGGPPADAGAADAGAGVSIEASPPGGPRRGPVLLRLRVIDPEGSVTGVRLELGAGGLATVLSEERSAGEVKLVWSSFADAPVDGTVALRAVAVHPGGEAEARFSVEVRNRPDADRLVLTAHRLEPLDGGGASPDGTGLSAFRFGGQGDGGVLGPPARIDVGAGPSVLRAAPHGRAVAVLEETAGTVSLVETPLDAAAASVRRGAIVTLPHGAPADVRWSRDGRYLFIAGGLTASQPPTLWRVEPAEDLSTVAAPEPLAVLPGPPSVMDVDRSSGRLLVACGSGGVGLSKVLLLSEEGLELARLEADLAPLTGLAFSPDGALAISAANLFGPDVRRYRVGPASVAQEGVTETTVQTPFDVVFHPLASPPVALVSGLDKNVVTPLVLGASLEVKAPVAGVPLASELDVIERGPQAGTVFVSSVTKVVRVALGADGSATHAGAVIDFGTGVRNVTHGMAVQR